MNNKSTIMIIISFLSIIIFGCSKETKEIELQTEQNIIDETSNYNLSEENIMETRVDEQPVYAGNVLLTEDNMSEMLHTFFCIKKSDSLKILETLPLTEDFFNQCISDFPYIVEVENGYNEEVTFWMIDENNKCICLFEIQDSKELTTFYSYSIEMEIVNNQIDSVKIEKIK